MDQSDFLHEKKDTRKKETQTLILNVYGWAFSSVPEFPEDDEMVTLTD